MKKLLLFLLPIPFLACAQGVHFEDNLSWTAVQAKAKAENKYIFMDCFTTWCGPCKYMAAQIFPQKASGDYLNDKFISVSVQLDTSKADNDTVKAWYGDAHDIAVKYDVRAYPTYLIFAPDGHVVHRLVGSRLSADAFIKDLSGSFDSTKQYYTLLGQYTNGRHDTAFLREIAMACLNAYDLTTGRKIAMDYLSSQSNIFSRDALYLADTYTLRSTDKYFPLFVDHAAEIDKVLGPQTAEIKVRNVFVNEGAGRRFDDNRPPDWDSLHARIAAKAPAVADELILRIKINYYRGRKDWPDFEKAIVTYMKTYSDHINDGELNDLAWSVFQNCPDMTCVSEVLDWGKRLKDDSDGNFVDTYANILYKLGKKDEAIALETKAISIVSDADKTTLQGNLDKMKKGESTW